VCEYFSLKNKFEEFKNDIDLLAIAGGDGTVRKVTKHLLNSERQIPLTIIPLGTANNIATTLNISGSPEEIIKSWRNSEIIKFDVGKIEGVSGAEFFLEGVGVGLFPLLMMEAQKINQDEMSQDEKIQSARELLQNLIHSHKPEFCRLNLDDDDFSGKYFLVEIMNTRSIGPNLFLAPDADPADDLLNVVMIAENQIHTLADFVIEIIEEKDPKSKFLRRRAKKIEMQCGGGKMHVDDELHELKNSQIKIELGQKLEILKPLKPLARK
jgi:diacylglycerol kinase family enzyme